MWFGSGAFLASFVAVTVLVHARALAQADQAAMSVIKTVTGPEIDAVGGALTYVAAAEVSVAFGGAAALGLWVSGMRNWRALAPLLFLATVPIELALKAFVDQPVPSAEMYRPTLRYVLFGWPTMQSFPSGHSIRAMFIGIVGVYLAAVWAGPRARAVAGVTLFVVVIASGWTRAYLGHHWPTDIAGGWLFGAGAGLAAVGLLRRARPRRPG